MPPQRKYSHLTNDLRAAILSGALAVGDPLPSETRLMVEHGMARMSARAVIDPLVGEGLATRVHGSGTFVADAATVRRCLDIPREMSVRIDQAADTASVTPEGWIVEAIARHLDDPDVASGAMAEAITCEPFIDPP